MNGKEIVNLIMDNGLLDEEVKVINSGEDGDALTPVSIDDVRIEEDEVGGDKFNVIITVAD